MPRHSPDAAYLPDRLRERAALLDKVEESGMLPTTFGTEAPLLREAAAEIDRLLSFIEEQDRYETCREAFERYCIGR